MSDSTVCLVFQTPQRIKVRPPLVIVFHNVVKIACPLLIITRRVTAILSNVDDLNIGYRRNVLAEMFPAVVLHDQYKFLVCCFFCFQIKRSQLMGPFLLRDYLMAENNCE